MRIATGKRDLEIPRAKPGWMPLPLQANLNAGPKVKIKRACAFFLASHSPSPFPSLPWNHLEVHLENCSEQGCLQSGKVKQISRIIRKETILHSLESNHLLN